MVSRQLLQPGQVGPAATCSLNLFCAKGASHGLDICHARCLNILRQLGGSENDNISFPCCMGLDGHTLYNCDPKTMLTLRSSSFIRNRGNLGAALSTMAADC